MDEKRLVVALFGVVVAAVLGAVAYKFIAPLTVSVFLYYSTRRLYRSLGRLRLPARVRAAIVMSVVAVPLLLLLSYTVVLVVIEARDFVQQYAVIDLASDNLEWLDPAMEMPVLTIDGLYSAYQAGNFDLFITFAADNAAFMTNLVTGFFLNLLIVVVVTYYLLIDGSRIRGWLLRFDDEAIVREYLEAVDDELEAVLFGNLLNVIAITLIAIAVFMGYNALVPASVEVPYPALAGALTGIASLIPVVGMKIIYVPLAGIAAIPIVLGGELALLAYIVAFLVIVIVFVDTIPDLLLRPYLSGKTTHVGLLMLAYILGPVTLGFYGLFFAPIVLVVGLTFAMTALPRLLGADPGSGIPDTQTRLDEF